jgi:probable phosphoglycerate mutase
MIVSQHLGQTVLLVGHDSVNRIFLLLALELPLSRYWLLRQSPCGVSVLEHSGMSGWVVASVNETAHLGAFAGLP